MAHAHEHCEPGLLVAARMCVQIKPGMPEGTQFVFKGEGDMAPNVAPGSVVFVLKCQPHDRFSRRCADLLHEATIPLYQALAGTSLPIQTLDGRSVA